MKKQHKTLRFGKRWFFFKVAGKEEPFWWHPDKEGRQVRSWFALTTHQRETGHATELICGRFLFATIKAVNDTGDDRERAGEAQGERL